MDGGIFFFGIEAKVDEFVLAFADLREDFVAAGVGCFASANDGPFVARQFKEIKIPIDLEMEFVLVVPLAIFGVRPSSSVGRKILQVRL